MPRLTTSLPKYRKHKASGQAIVNAFRAFNKKACLKRRAGLQRLSVCRPARSENFYDVRNGGPLELPKPFSTTSRK